MTCIATDGRSIAADGRMTSEAGEITHDRFLKLVSLPDGSVLGLAGTASDITALRAWARAGAPEQARPKLDPDSEFLNLRPNGRIEWSDHRWRPVPQAAPAAIGSGGDIAIGAMLAGRSPRGAVKLAARRVTTVGGRIVCRRVRRPDRPR